ncbi:MAG: hypothetical protein ACXVAB_01305 [Thermodesulfobacteriota bacterium]
MHHPPSWKKARRKGVPFLSGLIGAGAIGAPYTLIIGGTSCLLGSFIFTKKLPLIREMVRPIYIKKGVLSEKSE